MAACSGYTAISPVALLTRQRCRAFRDFRAYRSGRQFRIDPNSSIAALIVNAVGDP